jgi:hypothetical protein
VRKPAGSPRQTGFGAFLAALALSSCSYPIYIHGFVKPEGPYGDVIALRTRFASVLHNADEMLYAFATIETPEFCEARTERLATAVNVPVAEARRYGGDVTAPMDGIVFFVSIHTGDSGANDLDLASSRWSLRLQGPGGIVSPSVVKRIRSSYSAVEALYPYLDRAYTSYRVAFPGGSSSMTRAERISPSQRTLSELSTNSLRTF